MMEKFTCGDGAMSPSLGAMPAAIHVTCVYLGLVIIPLGLYELELLCNGPLTERR